MNRFPIVADSEPPEVSRHCSPATNPAGAGLVQTVPKRSLRILCIDDDEQVRSFLNDCLTHFEHRVAVASGGNRGIELFRAAAQKNQPYDVVLTDLGMPGVDGQHVARILKAESPHTPIILMTGWGMSDEGEDAPPEVDAVVGKPPHMQELNALLLRLVPPPAG
jgi:CheY-like chemotaxis protein